MSFRIFRVERFDPENHRSRRTRPRLPLRGSHFVRCLWLVCRFCATRPIQILGVGGHILRRSSADLSSFAITMGPEQANPLDDTSEFSW